MEHSSGKKLLIAVDGSEQAMEAVRYVSRTVPSQRVEVVLFHVLTRVPESFWDLEKEPGRIASIANIKTWEMQQQKMIEEFMAEAVQVLWGAGIPKGAIKVDLHERRAGIARDIIAEAQTGYDAVVVARRGRSELKDLVIGSIANKLVEKLVDVPVWLVGSHVQRGKLLIPMDASEGAMRSVHYVASVLQGGESADVTLFHAIRGFDIFQQVLGQSFVPGQDREWVTHAEKEMEAASKEIEPVLEAARQLLVNSGFKSEKESSKIVKGVSSRAGAIIEEAQRGGYDTIVMGRRGVSRVQEFFMGRVSNKVIQLARDRTVWVVS